MKQILYILLLLTSTAQAQIPVVDPPVRSGVSANVANGYLKLNSSGKIDATYYTTGTISAQGTQLLTNGNSHLAAHWQVATTKASGASITDADVDSILFYKVGSTYYKRFFYGHAQMSWWPINMTDDVDDYAAAQAAVSACIAEKINDLDIPSGKLTLSRGLKIRRGGNTSVYVGLSLHGDGNAYDPNDLTGGTQVNLLDATGAAIYIQRGKGLTIENIRFTGQNVIDFNEYQVTLTSTDWSYGSVSTGATNAHCAIAIDRLFTSGITNKYALETAYYTENGAATGGSTSIKIKNVYINNFYVGIAISGVGMQNGENIFIENPWIDHVYAGITTGDVQNRTVRVENYTSWGSVYVHFDSKGFGYGCAPVVHGANIAGSSNMLVRLNDAFGEEFAMYDAHTELMKMIGGCLEGQSSKILLYNCDLDLTGSIVSGGNYIPKPNQIVQCETFNMIGGRLTYYNGTKSMFGASVKGALLQGVYMTSPLINSLFAEKITHSFCTLETFNKYLEDLAVTESTAKSVVSANVNRATDTWTYTVDNATGIEVGNYVLGYNPSNTLTGEFTANNIIQRVPLGRVTGVSGTTITVTGVPYQLVNGLTMAVWTRKYSVPS